MGRRKTEATSRRFQGHWQRFEHDDPIDSVLTMRVGQPVPLRELPQMLALLRPGLELTKEGEEVLVTVPVPAGAVEADESIPGITDAPDLEVIGIALVDRGRRRVVLARGATAEVGEPLEGGPGGGAGRLDEQPVITDEHRESVSHADEHVQMPDVQPDEDGEARDGGTATVATNVRLRTGDVPGTSADLEPFLVVTFVDTNPMVNVNLQAGPEDPRMHGLFFADVFRTIARAFVLSGLTKDGKPMMEEEVLDEMREFFDKEWVNPTSDIKMKRPS